MGIGFGGNGNARARKYSYMGKKRYDFAAFMEIMENNQVNISMDLDEKTVLKNENIKLICKNYYYLRNSKHY